MNEAEIQRYLEHFGVKGMHWGVRRNTSSAISTGSGSSENSSSDHKNLKTAGIVLGSAAGIALIAAGSYYLAKNGNLPLSSFSSADLTAGKKVVEDLIKPSAMEPTGVVHFSGGHRFADTAHRKGGLGDLFPEAIKAGLVDDNGMDIMKPGTYRRYGSNLEKVAVRFHDPKGRKDAAGRPIMRSFVLPKQHTHDITNFEEAKARALNLTEADYEKLWGYSLAKDSTRAEARRRGLMD